MNAKRDVSTADADPQRADSLFDLLVDGELSEPERREFLSGLDGQPDGWRRCALAFLESQALRRECAALAAPPAVPAPRPRPARRPAWFRHLATALAMAASFLVAWTLGTYIRSNGRLPALRPAATDLATTTVSPTPGGGSAVSQTPSLPEYAEGPAAHEPWQTVRLTANRGAQQPPQSIDLPAVSGDQLDEAWLKSIPAPMPAGVLQALRESGHDVQLHRRLVPMEMKDGRRLVVPLDQVDIHYVGRPAL